MRIGGLASGMDTDSIIKELMSAQRVPLDRLLQQKTFAEWQQQTFRDTNLAFSKLRTSASNLRLQSSFNAYSATSLNTGSVTASTTANAVVGNYTAQVLSVASPAKFTSVAAIEKAPNEKAQSTDLIGAAGTITVSGSDGSINTVSITETMTYSDVAKAMQDATAGSVPELRASFDNTTSRFFISTKSMGADQNFTIDFSSDVLAKQIINDGLNTTATTTNGTFGSVEVDGVLVDSLKTNQTTVNGLTLNLIQAGDPTTINIQADPTESFSKIKDFVESYNEIIVDLENKLIEKRYPDFQPLSDDQKKDMTDKEIELWEEKARSGLIQNDPLIKNALRDLRSAFMSQVTGLTPGTVSLSSDIGINTAKYEGGKLFIDEEKLKGALRDNPEEVMQLFTNKTGGTGIGERVYTEINNIIKRLGERAGSPSYSVDNSVISNRIKQMEKQVERWEDRLTRIEDRYWKQFTAMEKALSQMNSQSAWMQQNMFGGM